MISNERQTLLWWLAVLGSVCLTAGQITINYIPVRKPMPWNKAREYCQRHYVDLVVLSTEERYFTLRDATASNNVSYWLGLQRQGLGGGWKWVDGEDLTYKQWYNCNPEGHCVSLEAMLKEDRKLLPRLCNEPHMPICQGPVSPRAVMVNPVSADSLNLTWHVSSAMQKLSHYYNVTMCTDTCQMRVFSSVSGSARMNVAISNLAPATAYIFSVAAFIVRPDGRTGEEVLLQDKPITIKVKTGHFRDMKKILGLFLNLFKVICVAPPAWILYQIFKKDADLGDGALPVLPAVGNADVCCLIDEGHTI